MKNIPIIEVESHKHLGLNMQENCQWNTHISSIITKVSPMINCLRSFKYRLHRKTLQNMYNTFILPIFEYSSVVWDNCTKEQATLLENLHLDALRTICGATRGTSHSKLYTETGYKSLQERRHQHKLCLFYKMIHKLAPDYLRHLLPHHIHELTHYNLRNASQIRGIHCNTVLYNRSFLPHTIDLWNALPENIKMADSYGEFKRKLMAPPENLIFFDINYGSRKCQITHARIRLGCSDLNAHLDDRYLIDNPKCSCGSRSERAYHYLFMCKNYTNLRSSMYFYTGGHDINIILHGSRDLSDEVNNNILQSVHDFFIKSRRFKL
jgi:hypothetical protein